MSIAQTLSQYPTGLTDTVLLSILELMVSLQQKDMLEPNQLTLFRLYPSGKRPLSNDLKDLKKVSHFYVDIHIMVLICG